MRRTTTAVTRRLMLAALVIGAGLALIVTGCGGGTTTTTAAQQSGGTGTTSTAGSEPTKTIKIGSVWGAGSDVGLDAVKGIKLMIDEDNANGGLDIGGEKYKVELVDYPVEPNQAAEVSAINKLVFEDKVQYILTQGNFEAGWLKTTEENKVVVLSLDLNAQVDLAPTTKYSFNPTFMNPEIAAKIDWYIKQYPDKVKNVVVACIDNEFGHMAAGLNTMVFAAFGVTPTTIFFPASSNDLSAVATKIKSLDPTTVVVMTGGSNTDGAGFNAVYQAGYRGQFFTPTNNPEQVWTQVMAPEALDGFICGMYVTESDPAQTETAQHYKELWTAKYGEWTDPLTIGTSTYSALKAALIKAGATDPDKVSEALATGLEFSSPSGDGKMISRPDLGNERTVDSVATYYMKQFKGNTSSLLATIKADDALTAFRAATAAPPAGAPPAGAPPAGAPPTS